jgi:hypothetical protein
MAAFRVEDFHGECKRGYKTGAVLGSGEQGTAYVVDKNDTGANAADRLVMKVSNLKADQVEPWKNEAIISNTLGEAGIGPKIFKAWICDQKGYIIMEKMESDLRHYPEAAVKKIGEDGKPYYIDHINKVPETIQKDYLKGLENMIDMGYVHMDNHPGNLGIVRTADGRQKGILFDFGFTQHRRDITSMNAKLMALGFSVAQIIEQMPLAERKTNFLYKVFIAIAQNKYVWGSGSFAGADVTKFTREYKATDEKFDAITAEPVPADVPRDIYIGFRLYCFLLPQSNADMFDRTNYERVYKIRQGQSYNVIGGKRNTRRHRRRAKGKSRKH